MKLRKILLILLALSLLLTISMVGAMFAYMYRQTEKVTNTLVPAEVSCEVIEAFDGTNKSSIKVRNTGNIAAYVRVRLVSYWVDEEGKIMPETSVMPTFTTNEEWLSLGNSTYCFKSAVNSQGETSEPLTSKITLGIHDKGYKQVVVVFAEAIQAQPAGAVESAWPVEVNADGTLSVKTSGS